MTQRLGKPEYGQSPRFLTQTEAKLAGIPRSVKIRISKTGKIFFSQTTKSQRFVELIRAEKKLFEYWAQPQKWRE